jgi:hypothetical protein
LDRIPVSLPVRRRTPCSPTDCPLCCAKWIVDSLKRVVLHSVGHDIRI